MSVVVIAEFDAEHKKQAPQPLVETPLYYGGRNCCSVCQTKTGICNKSCYSVIVFDGVIVKIVVFGLIDA